jgi:dipeptidyl aminopeptidase/acylaminoacyl peptidase
MIAVAAPGTPVTPEVALSFYLDKLDGSASAHVLPAWTPDSRSVLFAIADLARPGETSIEAVDVASGRRQRLGDGANPQVSPDGRSIAFVAGRGKDRQVWVMSSDGTGRRRLTDASDGLSGWFLEVAWSPDSRRLAYAFTPDPFVEPKAERPGEPSVVVYGSERDAPLPSDVVVTDVATGAPRKVGSYQATLMAPSWFPDGASLLVYAFRQGTFYREKGDVSELRAISVTDGAVRTLARGGGEEMNGSVSPDGKSVAFFYDPDDVRYPDMYEISLVPSRGGPIHRLTSKVFASPWGGPKWAPDGTGVYYVTKAGAFNQVFFVTIGAQVRQLTSSAAEHGDVAVAPDGRRLCWREQDAQGRRRLVVARADGSEQRTLVDFSPAFDSLALANAREVRWKSADGLEVAGILVEPAGYVPGKRYPLVVELHGGPLQGVAVDGEMMCIGALERQIWAAKGYAVLAPDYRSSGVYGWNHIVSGRERQDFMDRDFDDIMAGVDNLIQLGIADPKRMVVGGHSWGGFLTNWVITHTGRFKAAVSYEGGADFYVTYGSEYGVGGNTSLEWQLMGKPWEVPAKYFRNSALYQMKGVTTPTLFIVGDGTAYGGSYPAEYEFMYTALKQQGVDAGMLLYKREGHVVSRPENVRDLTARVVAWVDRYLK